jgi:predicted RNA binding protein YcfA (HicA-like mRNA interferase family)
MSNFPSLTSRKLAKLLAKKGFVLDRVKGSHQVWLNKNENKRVVLPMHKKDLPAGTLFAILRQAGIDKNETV